MKKNIGFQIIMFLLAISASAQSKKDTPSVATDTTKKASSLPQLNLSFSRMWGLGALGTRNDSSFSGNGWQGMATVYFFGGSNLKAGIGSGYSSLVVQSKSVHKAIWGGYVPFFLSFQVEGKAAFLRGDMGYNIVSGVKEGAVYDSIPNINLSAVHSSSIRNSPFFMFSLGLFPDIKDHAVGIKVAYMYNPIDHRLYPDIFPGYFTLGLNIAID